MSSSTRARGFWAEALRSFNRRPLNRVAIGVVALLVVVALLADFLASDKPLLLVFGGRTYLLPNVFDPAELRIYDNQLIFERMREGDWGLFPLVPWGYGTHDLENVFVGPSGDHWLGTDSHGRDVLARIIHGSRVSLAVGALSVTVLVLVGTFLGSVAGYFGGLVDELVMRVVEIVHSLPTLLLLVAMLAIVQPRGWTAIYWMMLVIGAVSWTGVARLVRGEILRVKGLDYVVASRAQGAGHARIIWSHVLPNALSPVLVAATFAMASAILLEGGLSYLGYGIPPHLASWGGLLNDVTTDPRAWWIAVFPGSAIFVTVTAFNLAGQGLRDAIDPRLGV